MQMHSESFQLSKSSFRNIAKAKWDNLSTLNFSNIGHNLDNCNLNDESFKILLKCLLRSIEHLAFSSNYFSPSSLEIIFEANFNNIKSVLFKESLSNSRLVFLHISKFKKQ